DVPRAVAGAERHGVAMVDDAAARLLDRERFERSDALARGAQLAAAAADRLQIMRAVGGPERHAIPGDQWPTCEADDVEDLPGARAPGAAIGAYAAAAAAFCDEEMSAVVRAQHDARLERVHERPLGFRTRAQPVLEKRRPGAEIDAELGMEGPPGGAGEL